MGMSFAFLPPGEVANEITIVNRFGGFLRGQNSLGIHVTGDASDDKMLWPEKLRLFSELASSLLPFKFSRRPVRCGMKVQHRFLVPAILAVLFAATAALAASGYHLLDTWKLGGEGGWDYLKADSEAHRL